MSEVENATFQSNKAISSGGAIFADDESTSINVDEYNHTLADTRFNLCFARFGNEPGNPPRVSQPHNTLPHKMLLVQLNTHSCHD